MGIAAYYAAHNTVPAPSTDPLLSHARESHILFGDDTGGGHKYGVGKPCKSEFPAEWSDEDIITAIQNIAANDNLSWKKGENGYYVAEKEINTLKIRVVLDGARQNIITGYPVNVPRNPCPAPANDNEVMGPPPAENPSGF
jgi:filamentous hemagglutinin